MLSGSHALIERTRALTNAYINVTVGNVKKSRTYHMSARAGAVEETRERILQAAYALLLIEQYDDVTLERVAERAGVSKQTLIRQFGSKDQLAYAVVDWQRPQEEAARMVEPGEVAAAVANIVERYERMGDANVRVLELEHRVPAIRYLLEQGRDSHRGWIERVFAPYLPNPGGAPYERRVMAFYAATEVMTWKLLRRDFALGPRQTQAVMLELVSGLVAKARATEE